MKLEEKRMASLRESASRELPELEEKILGLRERVEKLMRASLRHQQIISVKREKGEELGERERWLKERQERHELVRKRLDQLVDYVGRVKASEQRMSHFQPLQNQLDNMPDGFERKGVRPWKIVNSRFKTFQDIFTPDEAKVLPMQHAQMTPEKLDKLTLEACPLDPARVPDWFMQAFGLDSMDGLTEFEALELKAEAAHEIRKIFEHLHPMSAYRSRESYRILELKNYDSRHDGKIIAPHYLGRSESGSDRKEMQLFDSIYEAHRRTLYVEGGYEAENTKLHGVKGRVKDIQQSLIGLSADDPEKEKLTAMLLHEVEILEHVTSHHKADARDVMARVAQIKDSLGRHNPGAACAGLVRVINQLDRRLPQIYDKSRYVDEDRRILSRRIEQDATTMERCSRTFMRLGERLRGGRKAHSLYDQLFQLPDLTDMTVRPFNLYGGKISEKSLAIKDGMDARDDDFVTQEVLNAYVICKIFKIQHERERILRDIAASPMQTSIESLYARATSLFELVRSRELFPELTTGYRDVYHELGQKVYKLKERLEYYAAQNLSPAEKLAMVERLKAYLEQIDFPEILENLR